MIIGNRYTRQVRIGDNILEPDDSQEITDYSKYFAWGNETDEAKQLSLAILLQFTDPDFASEHHEDFAAEVLALKSTKHTLVLQEMTIVDWASQRGYSW